ncbi:MAG: response regulator [Proteobacteria bacterium]|nr:response regulator [Pseudomonadota bacterium]
MKRLGWFSLVLLLLGGLAGLVAFEVASTNEEQARVERYALLLEPYLWNLDVGQASQTAGLLIHTEDYQHVEVLHADGTTFFSADAPADAHTGGWPAQVGLAPLRLVEVDLKHGGDTIGQLKVRYPYRNASTHLLVLSGLFLLGFAGAQALRGSRQARELDEVRFELERRHRRVAEEKLSEREEQLRESQRLESLGRLAAGIAHDFNNILTAILGSAELLEVESPDAKVVARARTIANSAERAAALTAHLLAFGRQQVLEPRVLELNGIVFKMQEMLRRMIGDQTELVAELTPGIGTVRADPSQIERILLNLVVNASEAMPNGGRVTVHTEQRFAGTDGREWVVLSVQDEGVGMDEQTRLHMFEPFFSAKKGGGTGLGLSTVHGIVHQSDGQIRVRSAPGEGTTFEVFLPVVHGDVSESESVERRRPENKAGRVLVVEDQVDVRVLVCEVLRGSGYEVIEAHDGLHALERVEGKLPSIDLVVTDVSMPGLNGKELADRLRSLRPDLPVLFMSGYAADGLPFDFTPGPGIALLEKPFSPIRMLELVGELLQGRLDTDASARP